MSPSAVLLAGALQVCRPLPPKVATILVRVDDRGRVVDRRAGSDRFARLRHEGWLKAVRPPGVCIRTALRSGRPAWIDRRPSGLPVVWDSEGLWIYRQRHLGSGMVPLPSWVPEEARP